MRPERSTFRLETAGEGWTVGRFPALDALPGVIHVVTTSEGPRFAPESDAPETVMAAWEVADHLRLPGIAWARQVHGGEVLDVRQSGPAGEADALVSGSNGLGIMGRSADCPLILVAGPREGSGSLGSGPDAPRTVVGMAHASWRSTVAGITGRMVRRLVEWRGMQVADAVAVICPSAGPCCYEVGDEVRTAAMAGLGDGAQGFFARRDDRWHFDLWQAATAQLLDAGLPPASIHVSSICTICGGEPFPSYRREGRAATRFAAVIAAT